MKRLTLILIYSLFSVIRINAQNLTVDQTTYTVEQLVEEVLINSICANVSNISFSTGASTNENGIAFFEEPTGAFPFSEGLLLASGDANGAAGPNTNTGFSSGSISWDGDTDLTTLAGNLTYNATTIEFNFVPYSTEISFRFFDGIGRIWRLMV